MDTIYIGLQLVRDALVNFRCNFWVLKIVSIFSTLFITRLYAYARTHLYFSKANDWNVKLFENTMQYMYIVVHLNFIAWLEHKFIAKHINGLSKNKKKTFETAIFYFYNMRICSFVYFTYAFYTCALWISPISYYLL